MAQIWLSPSGLGLFKECPRCFWLAKNIDKAQRLEKPKTIMPTILNGLDGIYKNHWDRYRQEGALPPEVRGQLAGFKPFQDQGLMDRWRNWKSGLKAHIGKSIVMCGALDECVVTPKGLFAPFDYKSRGAAQKEGGSEKYYQHQLDSYSFMMEQEGYAQAGFACLGYYWPTEVTGAGAGKATLTFACEVERLDVDKMRAVSLAKDAADCLTGTMPAHGPECNLCNYLDARRDSVQDDDAPAAKVQGSLDDAPFS